MATQKETASTATTGVKAPAKKTTATTAVTKTSPKKVAEKKSETKSSAKTASKKSTVKTIPSKTPEKAISKTVSKTPAKVAAKVKVKKDAKPGKAAKTKSSSVASVSPVSDVDVKEISVKKAVSKKKAAKATAHADSKGIVQLVVKQDVGFGNKLYIRGDAPGLSWEKGTLLENTASDEWVWRGARSSEEYEVKVLLNDELWDLGENVVVTGSKVVHYPIFQ